MYYYILSYIEKENYFRFFSVSISGGEDRSCSYNIVEKYDPRKDVWMFGPSLKRRRAGAGVTVCDGKIFVAGKNQICL